MRQLQAWAWGALFLACVGSQAGGQQPTSPPKVVAPSKVAPAKAAPTGPLVAVIPLHGTVGACNFGEEWFSAVDFAKAVAKAEKAGAKTVVLEIHSPGGLTSTEEKILTTIVEASGRGVTFAAMIDRDAGPGAARIAVACKHIFATPAARFGDSEKRLAFSQEIPGSPDFLDFEASFHGKDQWSHLSVVHGLAAHAAGRSPCLCTHLLNLDSAEPLWWSATGGLSETRPPDPAESVALILNTIQLEHFGIGKSVGSRANVLEALGLASARVDEMRAEMTVSPNELKGLIRQATNVVKQLKETGILQDGSKRSPGDERGKAPSKNRTGVLMTQAKRLEEKIKAFVESH